MNLGRTFKRWFYRLQGRLLPIEEFPEEYADSAAVLVVSNRCQLYLRQSRKDPLVLMAESNPHNIKRTARDMIESLGLVTIMFSHRGGDQLLILSDSQELLGYLKECSAVAALTLARGNKLKLKKVKKC